MDTESLAMLRQKADEAFGNKDFETALVVSKRLAAENIPSAMFTCGLILEKGWLNDKIDLNGAEFYYRKLAINFNDDEGYLGCVRIMLARREMENRDTAMQYCMGAANGRIKHLAFILMGRIYEEFYDPPDYKLARRAYLKSVVSGSAWALRKYAMSLMKSKNIIGGICMHVIATIVSPFFVLFGGVRTTRTG